MNGHVSKKTLARRWAFLGVGLMIMAFGVAFSIKAGLGTSPISSLPYVVSCFSSLSVGQATIIMHCAFILLQIIILRKRYEIVQLLQLPVAIIFGYLTDFSIYVIQGLSCHSYIQQWICCVVGIVVIAVGISFEVVANAVTLAGEGLILAICKVSSIKFGNMKVLFDVALVCSAIVLSLIFMRNITGVREGTVAAALLVGTLTKRFNKILGRATEKLL